MGGENTPPVGRKINTVRLSLFFFAATYRGHIFANVTPYCLTSGKALSGGFPKWHLNRKPGIVVAPFLSADTDTPYRYEYSYSVDEGSHTVRLKDTAHRDVMPTDGGVGVAAVRRLAGQNIALTLYELLLCWWMED
jgi:hypothetical protein